MAFECLKKLHEAELYTNVVHLGGFLTTIVERRSKYLSIHQQYQSTVYFADALYHTGQYKKAGQMYMKALAFLKNRVPPPAPPTPSKSRSSSNNHHHHQIEMTPENEVKFRLHLCLVKQSKLKEAVGVLDSIPKKSRSPKVNAALGELHRKLNLVQQATQCYKDLLAEIPFAIDAAVELLQLGVPTDELLQTCGVMDMTHWAASLDADEWLERWLVGHCRAAKRDYVSATSVFRDLDAKTMLANNPHLLCQLAKAYYSGGEYARAISVFQRIHSLDPLYLDGMDILASLLADDKSRTKELESLATQLMSSNPESPVSWVAMGYLCKAMKKYPKALYFAHKACGDAQTTYVEAMLLKGCVLLESKKWAEGALHFHEALVANPHRFELYEGLVNCHLEQHKMKEARVAAAFCIKQIGQNARTITLYASVLGRDQSTISEAQAILEKAVSTAPHLLKAVYLLVDIYDKQGNYDRAIDLLRRQTSTHVKNRLHRLLGDFLSKADRPNEALDSYRFALSLEPGDSQAEAGLYELGDRLRVDTQSLCGGIVPSTSNDTDKTPTDTGTGPGPGATQVQDRGSMEDHSSGPDGAGPSSVTPSGPQPSTYNSSLLNAPSRRTAPNGPTTSASSSGTTSLVPVASRLVVSLDTSAMTPLTDNEGDPTTSADIHDEEMLSGGDDSGPLGDGGSDVY